MLKKYVNVLALLSVCLSPIAAVGAVGAEESKPTTPTQNASQPALAEDSKPAASVSDQNASAEQLKVLKERVDRYWEARQARDIRTLYDLESAARPGGWLKLENAMSLQGLPVRKVKVEEVKIEGEKGFTRISAEVSIGTLGWIRQTIEDPWILLDGQWYHETSR